MYTLWRILYFMKAFLKLKYFYFNISLKYKILILFYCIVLSISLILGCNSYIVTKKQVISNISTANIGKLRQISNSIKFLQKDVEDISTYLCIDPVVQSILKGDYTTFTTLREQQLYIDNSMSFILNLIASKSYISMISFYNNNNIVYYRTSDGSSEVSNLNTIRNTEIYKTASNTKGRPLWFTIKKDDPRFIQNNNYNKIAACRIIKDFNTLDTIGFLIISVNESEIQNIYKNNMDTEKESILIIDNIGELISHSGETLLSNQFNPKDYLEKRDGFTIKKIEGTDFLITYTDAQTSNWKLFHAVSMKSILNEVISHVYFSILIVVGCVLLSFPLIMLISNFLTSPIYRLLESMKRFEEGNFNEKIDFKYQDEIGKLGKGYNSMVANIKDLINKVYVLQIKEREAELKALQSQINPHFLYNTME